jgi:type II secretory pathway component GspD/PulD (secretin)
LATGTLIVGLAAAAGPTRSAPLMIPETPYKYTVLDQDVATALQEFGSNLNVKVNVSQEVRGRIQGRLPELPARVFLDHIASLFNLQWYYDGLVLYVTAAREAQSRLLVLAPISFDDFKISLRTFGIADERYIVKPAPNDGLVLVVGPPRFVTLAEQTLVGLVAEAQARPKRGAVRASSGDVLIFRGSQLTVVQNGRPK